MKKTKVYQSIRQGLAEAIDHEKGNKVRGLKTKSITIKAIPSYDATRIRNIRNRLRLTQSFFAAVLGVSIKTVEAWESGRNVPQGPAQRMLWLLEKDNNLLKKYKILES